MTTPPPFDHGIRECPDYPHPYPITEGLGRADQITMIRLLYSIDVTLKRQEASMARLVELLESAVFKEEVFGYEGSIRVYDTNALGNAQ